MKGPDEIHARRLQLCATRYNLRTRFREWESLHRYQNRPNPGTNPHSRDIPRVDGEIAALNWVLGTPEPTAEEVREWERQQVLKASGVDPQNC